MPANYLHLCIAHESEVARKFDHLPELIKALAGEDFENTFLPIKV